MYVVAPQSRRIQRGASAHRAKVGLLALPPRLPHYGLDCCNKPGTTPVHRPVDEHAPYIYTAPVYSTAQSAGLMNGIFAPGEEALFVSPSPNLTGATLDLTGAVAPVSFTGAFGTIFLSPTQGRLYLGRSPIQVD